MLINVLVKGEPGQMDDSLLERKDVVFENDDELTTAVEYWLDGELVHRSVHVQLKKDVFAELRAATFG